MLLSLFKAGTICHPIDCNVWKSQPGAFLGTSAQLKHSTLRHQATRLSLRETVEFKIQQQRDVELSVNACFARDSGTMESSDREGTFGNVADVGDFQTLVTRSTWKIPTVSGDEKY